MRWCKILFTGGLVFSFYHAQAQADKLIDAYESASDYFTATFPSGTVNISNNTTDYTEGNSALQIDYNVPAGVGNFAEVFRNFGTTTQDLSFQPDKLTLQVKGSVGNSELFRFWLYEDQNSNGSVDAGDEYWYFDAPAGFLNSTSFQQLDMPLNAFTLFAAAGGNSTLDLNRIRAFRITVNNTSGAVAANNSVIVDELRQVTSYTPITSGVDKISGSFIQIWNGTGCSCGGWTISDWEEAIDSMQALCMDKVIVQYSVYEDNAWYTPSALPFVNFTNATLNNLFQAAENKGFEVILGPYFSEGWNTDPKNATATYDDLLLNHQAVIDELWGLFGTSVAFGGWYIPQEINDLEWQGTMERNLLADWLEDVASYAKSKGGGHTVMIAPFFNLWQPADLLEVWYDSVLTRAPSIDKVYPQDGVGITLKDVDTDIPHYFAAIKAACDNHGVIFGATVETFQQTDGWPINGNPFASVPASINRIKPQLWEAGVFADDIIQFSWSQMQPGLSGPSTQLFEDYNDYVEPSCTPLSIVPGVKTTEDENLLLVYPNPAGESLTVSFPVNTIDKIIITDLSGKQLYFNKVGETQTVIDVRKIGAGLYLLQVFTDGQQVTEKIIIK